MLARHYLKKMFKPLIAAVAAAPFFAASAFAGPYVNVEANASYPDGEYTTATTDLHIGYEGGTEDGKVAYYVQGGPGFVHTDSSDDTETEISGKVGVSVQVADAASVYGEISGISNEDSSGDEIIDFGGKLGVKYVF
jgi:outer membrane autotransporter protein